MIHQPGQLNNNQNRKTMDKETFVEELISLVEAASTQSPYTVDTPRLTKEIADLFTHAETASDILTVNHAHMRQLLTTAKEPFIDYLERSFTEQQLTSVGLFINPQEAPDFRGLHYEPYLLVSKSGTQLTIDVAPSDLTIYAHPNSVIQLSSGGAMICGNSVCHICEGYGYEASDFAYVTAGQASTLYCNGYSICKALDGSTVKGAGFSTIIKSGDADIHTYQSARIMVDTPNANFSMHRLFRPIVQTQPTLTLQYAYTDPVLLESTRPLILHTQYEQEQFQKALSQRPGNRPCLSMAKNDEQLSVWQLVDLFDAQFQSIDMELCDQLEGISDREDLTTLLAKHFEKLLPFLGIDFIRKQFDPASLAYSQIYVNDRVPINPLHLAGEFYVFGNHIVDQPAGTIGHYYEHTMGHVQDGIAYFNGESVGIATQAMLYMKDDSLVYGRNVTARLTDRTLGSFHGESIVDTSLMSTAYLYDQTRANSYHRSNIVLFDDATVEHAQGGTIYGPSKSVLHKSNEATVCNDKQTLDIVRRTGITAEINLNRTHLHR